MADFDPAALKQALISRGGYSDINAQNAAYGGPRSAELAREFLGVSTSSPNPTTGNTNTNNIIDQAKALQGFNLQANQPAIQNIQGYVPQVQRQFETQKNYLQGQVEPLKARYQNLLDTLTNQQTTETNRQTVTTANELGRRGILPSSGLGEQTITSALNPITRQYSGQLKDVGFQQQADINSLLNTINQIPGQQASAIQPLLAQIAQLQTGNPSEAISNAQAIQNAQNQYALAQKNYELQQQQLAQQIAQFGVTSGQNAQRIALEGATIPSTIALNQANAGAASRYIPNAFGQNPFMSGGLSPSQPASPNFTPITGGK